MPGAVVAWRGPVMLGRGDIGRVIDVIVRSYRLEVGYDRPGRPTSIQNNSGLAQGFAIRSAAG